MAEKIEIFFCYARADEDFRRKLESQLSVLKHLDIISLWHDQNISAGADWREVTNQHMNAAHIVLLLISPDFMVSDFCFSDEVKRALERYALGEARVIPILLRATDWREAPFGTLQALPGNALPITAWRDPDEAFLNVTKGIKNVIGELITRQQPRNIALFKYEMQDGRASPLWIASSAFSLDGTYEAWFSTKRDFSSNEIIGQTWIKTSNPEHTFIIHFVSGGTFRERSLSDPGNQWQGSWELLDGMLRLRVNKYELDIFANRESSVHSGIEFTKDIHELHSYFVFFPLLDSNPKHWDINVVPGLIERIFDQILHQRVDTKILITYGALLCRGEMSIRSIVKILGLSRRYKERFIHLKKVEETIEHVYATFLGRRVDAKMHGFQTHKIKSRGSNVFIADLIDSEEYQQSFGEDTLPSEKRSF
ncbi:MAG: phycobilisome rod-core linker polypeptide [Ktedonobacteraceae bacterium]|nr:phycobilisome rod-core linker polypeptide [Chloroflexota bacterium]